jgi:arabinogalactan endo-1,4-beta-galactosidase
VGTAGDSGGGQGGSAGDGPVLVGNLLGNPSFEQQLTGWTVDPPSAVTSKYVYTQFPQGNGTTVDGSYELSVWHMTAEYEFSIYQVVKRLTPGIYSFKGSFSSQAGREAYLFARNCGGTERQVSIPHVSFEWFEIAIPDIEVTSSSCEVGFFVHNVGADWLNADMFTFEKVP